MYVYITFSCILPATIHSMIYSTRHAIYIHTHPQRRKLDGHKDSKNVCFPGHQHLLPNIPPLTSTIQVYSIYRYICNCVNSTTPYHYHKYSTLNKPYLGSHSVLSHSALSFGTLDTRSNTTEANRVTEAGRTKRVMERRPKKLATVWVAILIVSQ